MLLLPPSINSAKGSSDIAFILLLGILDEPNPKFFKLYEFEADFPGAAPLTIKAYDYDDLFGDDAEPNLYLVEPGAAGRGEVEGDVRVTGRVIVKVTS